MGCLKINSGASGYAKQNMCAFKVGITYLRKRKVATRIVLYAQAPLTIRPSLLKAAQKPMGESAIY